MARLSAGRQYDSIKLDSLLEGKMENIVGKPISVHYGTLKMFEKNQTTGELSKERMSIENCTLEIFKIDGFLQDRKGYLHFKFVRNDSNFLVHYQFLQFLDRDNISIFTEHSTGKKVKATLLTYDLTPRDCLLMTAGSIDWS